MAPLLRRYIIILNIYKKIKTRKKSITTIKSINKNLNKKNNSDEEDFKNNILFKIIKLFSGKEPSFNSLNNKELKLFFLLFLHCL